MIDTEKYLKTATVLATILVVLGHSLPIRFEYEADPINLKTMISIIYIFHMPFFFLISGFHCLGSIEVRSFSEILKNRFKRLVVPYFIFSFSALLPKFFLSDHALRPIHSIARGAVDILLYPWANPVIYYWFLPTLFFIYITFSSVFKIINFSFKGNWHSNNVKFFTLFIIVIVCHSEFPEKNVHQLEIFNISGILHYSFFFFLGVALRYFMKVVRRGMLIFFGILIFLICASGLANGNQIGLICAFGFFIFLIYRFVPTFTKVYPFCFGIYLLSFFFQIPTQFVVFALSNDAFTMLAFSFVFGFFGPILVMLAVKKFIPHGVLELAGVAIPHTRS